LAIQARWVFRRFDRKIAGLYGEWYDVELNSERVVVTTGSSAGFTLAFTSLFDAGARIAIGAPGYPSYKAILQGLDLEPVMIECAEENRLQPVPADLPHDIDGLLVASPANPSGTMLDKAKMSDLMRACADRGAAFISDEIYHGIEYERKAVTALEVSDEAYVINSFSKYFSMTGWRVGWMVVPEDHVRRIERLSQNFFICPPHVSQIAALAALDAREELNQNLEVYKTNRALMLEGLLKAGFKSFAPPDGAFYVYLDVSDFTEDSQAFATEVLEKAGVAVTPGVDFDPVRGRQTVRLSYCRSTADIEEGIARFTQFLAERRA
jgi:aspartate/methionine/tyrosine aminotransferase